MVRRSKKPKRASKGCFRSAGGAAPEVVEVTVTVPRDKVGMVKKYAHRISRARPSRRSEVLYHLRRQFPILQQRFGVRTLALFGSVARDECRMESDVDLLVEFEDNQPEGMFAFVALKQWLESILGRPVDLITPANLKPRLRDRILAEAIPI